MGPLNREELMRVTVHMLEHIAQCARRGQHGEWVLTIGEPRHDHRAGHEPTIEEVSQGAQFLGEVARACGAQERKIFDEVITPPEECNKRPLDPEWLALCDKMAEDAARALHSFVVLVAVQNLGKMGMSTGGEDLPGEELKVVKEMAEDMPDFLRKLAAMTEHMVPTGKHKKEPTLEFMPGCFDDWPGTQEQLQEFIAELRQMVASGQIREGARLMTREEVEELKAQMREREKRKGKLQ